MANSTMNLEIPESIDPYQYAYNNTLLFSDPSGELVIGDVNAAQLVKNILNKLKRQSVQEVKDYALEELGQGITSYFTRTLDNLIPYSTDLKPLQEVFDGVSSLRPSVVFERVAIGGICYIFEGLLDYFWFGVPMPGGNPIADGDNCAVAKANGVPNRGAGRPNPDFLIKPSEPSRRKRDGWLVGEIKYSVKDFYEKYLNPNNRQNQRVQYDAISRYAKNYQYVPVALYITYTKKTNTDFEERELLRDGARKGIIVVIQSIISGNNARGRW